MLFPNLGEYFHQSYSDLNTPLPLLANPQIRNSLLNKDDFVLFVPFESATFLDIKKSDSTTQHEFASAASYQFQYNFCFKLYDGYIGEFPKQLDKMEMWYFWWN